LTSSASGSSFARLPHAADRGEGARLHHARFGRERALREAVALPQDAQKGPVAERDAVRGKARLQRAYEATPGFLGEVG
jgi:hypothetical protein